jgi:hypothetical protein
MIPKPITLVLPDDGWTDPEKWVWEMICRGEVANFNLKFSKEADPKKPEDWAPERLISYSFLETVLIHEPYISALPRRGLRIAGALIKEKIDLSNARLVSELWLDKCRIEGAVSLVRTRTDDYISIERAFISGDLALNSLQSKQSVNLEGTEVGGSLIAYFLSIDKSLFLRGGTYPEIDMRNAWLGGQLDMSNAHFMSRPKPGDTEESFTAFDFSNTEIEGLLTMTGIEITGNLDLSGLQVHRDLYIGDGAKIKEIDMTGAEISGQMHVSGAAISEMLEMNGVIIHGDLFIRDDVVSREISLVGVKIDGQLDITKTKVHGLFDMDSIVVGTDLFIKRGIEFGELNIIGGTIGGNLDLYDVNIDRELNIRGLSVGLDLKMYKSIIGEKSKADDKSPVDIDMQSVKVAGQLNLSDTKMKDRWNTDGISVAGQLYLQNHSEFREIEMIGANIGGQISLSKIIVEGKMEIQSITAGQSIFMRGCEYGDRVSIIDSSVNGSIVTSTNNFLNLDLGGTKVQSELQMGESKQENIWAKGSALNLRNAKVGTLSDGGEYSWPDKINLDGFIYSGLGRGARGDINRDDIDTRDVGWLVGWLAREKPFSTQPYHQLSRLLTKMGYSERANSVLYAAKERERDLAFEKDLYWKWFGFSMLKWTIGYGYGARYFRSLIWVVALIIIGVLVIGTVDEGTMRHASMLDRFGFSLDKLIPVIELNDKYKLDFHGLQLAYFYFHKIMGVILSSFVVAGLSGITKE